MQTRYRYEQRVAADLAAKGVEHYLPLLHEVHQWKDRSRAVDLPAFGGYLFVRLVPSVENRVRVLETAGVVRVLGTNGSPEPVAESEIASLRLSLNSGRPCSRHPYLAVGAPVRIARGPLAGLEGQLVGHANSLRIVVSVASIGQAVSVELSNSDVLPLDAVELTCCGDVNATRTHNTRSITGSAAKEDRYVPAAFREPRQGTLQSRY
ncbi:transcription termination/antitermination protein NusG [Silvibacterium acidisoli]|uniref:transcription termination/antitermination protein NusG n=1 Tax=Acidobacteriaceae bacterium ZG23-2 TaxID=2883246 RepID=UPI00406C28AA